MYDPRFDIITRRLAGSAQTRRDTIRLPIAGALAAVLAHLGLADETRAAGACLRVGRRCRRDGQCCSGRCRGRQRNQRCRAHGVGSCRAGQSFCREGSAAACGEGCSCFRTTGGAGFCGRLRSVDCQRDADCVALGLGAGAACVRNDGPVCEIERTTFCAIRCGAVLPAA